MLGEFHQAKAKSFRNSLMTGEHNSAKENKLAFSFLSAEGDAQHLCQELVV
jgi:hypothetical protein